MIFTQLPEHVFGIQHADNVIDCFFVDRDARKAALQSQVYSLIDGGIALQHYHVDTRYHHLAHGCIGKLEDAADHLRFLFFEYTFFLAHIHQQTQLFFRHKGTTVFHLAAQETYQGVRNAGQQPDNRAEQPRGATYRIQKSASPAWGVRQGSSFRRNLEEDQHNQENEDCRNQLPQFRRKTERQHSSHTGSNDDRHIIDNEDGREEDIRLRQQLFYLLGFFVARFHLVLKFNAADRGKRCFSSRSYSSQQ